MIIMNIFNNFNSYLIIMYQFLLWLPLLIGLILYGCYNLEIVEAAGPHAKAGDFHDSDSVTTKHIFNSSNSLDNLNVPFISNAQIIATELIGLNETEIKDYPLADLPREEIKFVFDELNSGNLSKVLLNMEDNDIKNIYDKFTPTVFNKIIDRISESDKIQIQKRVE